jgi:hypothetical protein
MTWHRPEVLTSLGVGALAGLLLGIAGASSQTLQFSGDVSSGSLLQSFVTLVAAVFVTTHFQRVNSFDQREKEVLHRFFNVTLDALRGDGLASQGAPLVSVNGTLKRINMEYAFLKEVTDNAKYQAARGDLLAVEPLLADLRRLATQQTNAESDCQEVPDLEVKDGHVWMSESRLQLLQLKIAQISRRLVTSQIKMNKCQ